MQPEALKDYFVNKIKNRDYGVVKGMEMSFHIPVKDSLINYALAEKVSGKVDGIRSVQIRDLAQDEFIVDLEHEKIGNKSILCRIDEVEHTLSGPQITIRFLEGLRFYEKAALNTFFALKKGWGWFKSRMNDDDSEEQETGPGVKISGSKVVIHAGDLLRKKDMGFIIPLVRLDRIATSEQFFIIDFRIKI